MKVKAIADHAAHPVTIEGAQGVSMRMLIGPKDGASNFHMRHFTVEPGGRTPHHSHDYEHEVLVLAGCGVVHSPQGEQPFKLNDVVFVPANQAHQFRNTGDEPCEFICLIPAPRDCTD